MPWVLTPENINAFNRPQSEDPETEWNFDSVPMQDDDLIAIGANLESGTLIQAYRHGMFPMPMDRKNWVGGAPSLVESSPLMLYTFRGRYRKI